MAWLVLLPACSFTTVGSEAHHRTPNPDAPGASAADRVRVLQNEGLSCSAEALGTVDVHEAMKNEGEALALLRRRAAALGAEAVVGVEFHHGEGEGGATHLSGMAVRCKDLIQGREYDVIGELDVPGEMEHEEEAFETIRDRASMLHADLIIDIHFEHGEGEGQPSRLTGKAIRFHPTDPMVLR
ncbi:MAG: hypothetical protein ABJE95_24275 [Byssovorax sp.]